ncbi:Probable RNA-binding protein ARP1-like [Zea mays]|uniref:Putative RNA-binding protein ARP1 n=1 Tax=Zea mays TaxID=4577 RepID=B4FJA7_MAIZE|nr:Probable RNA-binding protein ARP1-like [Zea mays]ACF82200.1 unknown [Zea mays]AQL07463.1 putative RNA-binding protein ARP1 [Zea mays]|eukprot:NP_001136575.1 uncharacterized protein LOC100216697 [Zea mays]
MTMMAPHPQPLPLAQPPAFGDTTLTKVFVGGLAWETHEGALRGHFQRYGDILEAVIISDKLTGRSKGYGFVTFKEADAAKKACEDATPVINGRRANCNLASLGAKPRPQPLQHVLRPSPPHAHALPSPHQPTPAIAVGSRSVSPVPWYYHPSTTRPPPPPAAHQQYHGVLPFYPAAATYGYSPNYVTDLSYNTKVGQAAAAGTAAGSYLQLQGHLAYQAAPAQGGMVPVYPFYHYPYHASHSQGLGVPAAHFLPPVSAAAVVSSKPTVVATPKAVEWSG